MKVSFGKTATLAFVVLALVCAPAHSQTAETDLTTLNLEQLMNLEVTSVSRKEQKISRTASAVFVITQEDIQQSGATNIPDLLRMVPGMDVAQINASKWAVSIRGFNGQYSNKLLVLVDGRTVYTPMLSGVFWDTQDVPLDCIERIEVIRGPGASVWGANAVNGVIDIITKKAQETQGGLLRAGGGTHEQGIGDLRYGSKVSGAAYRVFFDGLKTSDFPAPSGYSGDDDWTMFHGGFRVDTSTSAKDSIMIQGDAYRGDAGEIADSVLSVSPPRNGVVSMRDRYSGWDILSRWHHDASARSDMTLQVYFDRSTRGDPTYGIGVDTFDIDFEHHIAWGSPQDVVWGLAYRLSTDDTTPTLRISFTPSGQTLQLFSSFVQDEIAIRPHRLYFSLGTKLEHNDYTGFVLQPGARLTWSASPRHMLWAAVSQAQRTPSRSDTGIRVNYAALPGANSLPVLVSLFGNPDQKAEQLTDVEAGYRTVLSDDLSFDSTVFFSHYQHLLSVEPDTPLLETDGLPLHLLLPSRFASLEYGETHGVEVFANWKVNSRWALSPGYSFLTMHMHPSPGSLDLTTGPGTEGSVPNHQAQLRSRVSLRRHWQWNTTAYFVGRLQALAVPSYTRVDANVTWQPSETYSLTLAGQNLLRDRHLEFAGPDSSVHPSLIKRSVYAKLTWWF